MMLSTLLFVDTSCSIASFATCVGNSVLGVFAYSHTGMDIDGYTVWHMLPATHPNSSPVFTNKMVNFIHAEIIIN